MMEKRQVPQTVMNVKIIYHDQKILNAYFSILEILQSCMGRIQVNIHQLKNIVIVEKQNEKNVFIINNIFAKRKVKR